MSGFGAWLPGWRPFFSWNGRIGRRTFLGGYIVLCFLSAALGLLLVGSLSVIGMADFETINVLGLALIGAAFLPVSALFAQRAHDIGWSAAVPLGVFLLLVAPFFTFSLAVWDVSTGAFGYAVARAVHGTGLDSARFFSIVAVCNGLLMLFALFLIVRKGDAEANRFGPPPAEA